jgi:hypothetical protein
LALFDGKIRIGSVGGAFKHKRTNRKNRRFMPCDENFMPEDVQATCVNAAATSKSLEAVAIGAASESVVQTGQLLFPEGSPLLAECRPGSQLQQWTRLPP